MTGVQTCALPISSDTTTLAASPGQIWEEAKEKFEDVMQQIKPATSAVLRALRELADSPDEASVEFGVKLSSSAGMVIASASAEANFILKLTWKRKLETPTT